MRRLSLSFLFALLAAGQVQTRPQHNARGADECGSCHPAIARSFALTGMGRSFYTPSEAVALEDFSKGNPFFQKASATWYAMVRRNGALFQKRWRLGFDGRETDVDELSVDFVMGSGSHVRTYLHKTARGTLIELPLAWYSEGGGHWGMNPGHDRNVELPPRTIAYECMGCHNAYPAIPAKNAEPGSEYVYLDPLPTGIDCQRCHGPGADHIRAARQPGAILSNVRKAIVNPARLTAERQMEVCLQCHLETTSQQLPHSLAKYGKGPFAYVPGQPLGDYLLFFDREAPPPKDRDFEIAHSAYRLRQSRCYLESRGAMVCTTCHNPHEAPRGPAAEAHYNGVCAQCHAPARLPRLASHTPGANCIACHMPKRRTADVVGAVMTDHLIQRRAPAGSLEARQERREVPYRGEVIPYYPPPPASGENALYAALVQVTQGANLQAGIPRLAAEIARQKPQRPEFYLELGQALLAGGDAPAAIRAMDEAFRREPQSAVAATALGDALTQAGDVSRAVSLLEHAAVESPGDALLRYQLGLAKSAAGDVKGALTTLGQTVALDPRMAEAFRELGTLRAASNDLAGAETALRSALRIEPDLAEAALVLGQVLSARQDFAQAQYYFERAVKAAPEIPEAHIYLGTLLEARGDSAHALAEYLEAVKLRGGYGLAHLNAGRLLTARGERVAARIHFEKAAADSDAAVREAARAALQ